MRSRGGPTSASAGGTGQESGRSPSRHRLPLGRLVLTAFVVYLIYLWPFPTAMNLRHLYLARSLAAGTVAIDPYARRVGDAAYIGSHVYAACSPLVAIVTLPVVEATAASGLVSPAREVWSIRDEALALVPFTALAGALAAALAVGAVGAGLAALEEGAGGERVTPNRASILGALAFAFATPELPYATIGYSSALASAGLALAVAALARGSSSREIRAFALAGLGLGVAVAADYHAFWAALPLALAVVLARGPRAALGLALGGAAPAAILLGYHAAATGNPLRPPVTASRIVGDSVGAFPYQLPSPLTLFHLTLGPWKGLFLYWPVLLLGGWGLARTAREPGPHRWLARALLLGAAAVLLANAAMPARLTVSWFSWCAYGPRYSFFAVPCLAFGLARGLREASPRLLLPVLLASFLTAWAGAQGSWQFSVHEGLLELLALGPRLRGVAILGAVLGLTRDPEGAAALAAAAVFPALLLGLGALWRRDLGGTRGRWLAWIAAATLLHALLFVPWLLLGRGREDRVRTAAARRGMMLEASFTKSPRAFVMIADSLVAIGARDDARDLLRRGFDLAPEDPDVASETLKEALRVDDRELARAAVARLASLRPGDLELQVYRALELEALGDRARARLHWRAILAHHPEVGARPGVAGHLAALGVE